MTQERNRYPQLEIDLVKLKDNLAALCECCQTSSIEIAGVVKAFTALPEAVKTYDQSPIGWIGSSRLEQLRRIRQSGVRKPLMMVRIPMLSEVDELVQWADISLQSERSVLREMNRAAGQAGRHHQVILMIDLGDLREGFWERGELVSAALEVENELTNLKLMGIGTNLGCYGSVQATPEKMRELVSAAEEVEEAIGRRLDIISGGASTSVHMVLEGTMPKRINHLRVGEAILLGGIWGCQMDFMHKDVFTLRAEVVESRVKASHPVGELSVDAFGRARTYVDRGYRRRALLALGRADYGDPDDLIPKDPGVKVLGASSDHTILDIEDAEREIEVGDVVEFDLCYATLVYSSNSGSMYVQYKES